MKNKMIAIALFVVFVLGACTKAQPSQLPPTLMPSSTASLHVLPSVTYPPFNTALTPVYTYVSPTSSSTVTATPTLDYAALGLPSPTATPTFDYDGLASYYLTPFTPPPTRTGVPSQTPTPNITNMLPNVVIRKVAPQPPPFLIPGDTIIQQDVTEWLPSYIQTATDLVNYVDGNQKLYLQYIASWTPNALSFSSTDWFLKDDFDADGQPEWLAAIPARTRPDDFYQCGLNRTCFRLFFIFKKIGDMYYPVQSIVEPYQWWLGSGKVVLVNDLNNNHLLDIVFQADTCGTACSTSLRIGEWDGSNWKDYWMSAERSQVTFADLDGNSTVEILLKYSTGAASKYNSPYPFRENLIDVYRWKNDRYELVDQIYPPTGSMFATIFDIAHALEYKNAKLAFERINPVIENLDQSCDRMKTYVGIQAMLAYAIQGDSNGMKSTLTKLEKYCDYPRNAYVPAAKILWLSYEKSHDPISACQAMERF